MRSIQQRGPGPVPGPIPGPDPGPSRRQPGSTQRHWRPKPEPGTVQQAQRAGMRSAEPEAAEWLTIGALTGAAPALLPAPAPTANRSTAMTNNNLSLISFLPRLPPQAIGPRRCTITRTPLMTHRLSGWSCRHVRRAMPVPGVAASRCPAARSRASAPALLTLRGPICPCVWARLQPWRR
jgi:hypothetical protein